MVSKIWNILFAIILVQFSLFNKYVVTLFVNPKNIFIRNLFFKLIIKVKNILIKISISDYLTNQYKFLFNQIN